MRTEAVPTARPVHAPPGRRGQGTVEYLLMLSAAVAQIVLLSKFLVTFMPRVFDNIQRMVAGQSPWP